MLFQFVFAFNFRVLLFRILKCLILMQLNVLIFSFMICYYFCVWMLNTVEHKRRSLISFHLVFTASTFNTFNCLFIWNLDVLTILAHGFFFFPNDPIFTTKFVE